MNQPTHTTHHARRLVLALLFALLPMLATSATAAGQFTTLTIGSGTYNATQNQSGPGWSWTASTDTLEFFYDYLSGDDYNQLDYLINGNIALGASNPAALATIQVNEDVFINGNISCDGKLLVNVHGEIIFKVNGSLAGSLSVTGEYHSYDSYWDRATVTVSNDVTGNLSVADKGTVKVGGNVGGNLTVSGGVVTINGTVGGIKTTTGGSIVKENGAYLRGASPTISTNIDIPLNTLTPGVPDSGPGWRFDSDYFDCALHIEGSLFNYTLTGTAQSGIHLKVADTVKGSLTLDGVKIDGDNFSALYIEGDNPTVYIKNNNTLRGGLGIHSEADGVLTLHTEAGSTLTAIGTWEEGVGCNADLVLQGSGTFNFHGGTTQEDSSDSAIRMPGDLLVQGNVTVNATVGDCASNYNPYSGEDCGVYCLGNITIADNAKIAATGGSDFGAGGKASSGILLLSKLTVTSTAANALVAIGGVGEIVGPLHGSGIAALFDLQIAGTGSIKAIGDNALASVCNITIVGCKITAEASGDAGYALHAGGYNGATHAGGTVRITGGTVTANNITKPANIYYKTLVHTGGTLNGVVGKPDPDPKPDPDNKGGGGGGAPSLPSLALIAAMLAMRSMKKK